MKLTDIISHASLPYIHICIALEYKTNRRHLKRLPLLHPHGANFVTHIYVLGLDTKLTDITSNASLPYIHICIGFEYKTNRCHLKRLPLLHSHVASFVTHVCIECKYKTNR